ncbi:MAG: nuclear transport factor 2 family protein [Comamonadaceae bacterium]|nr:nuclear transport factor 2 family protein [Comamonadaceae bacterium]
MSGINGQPKVPGGEAKFIFEQWHQTVIERDLDALMNLYAQNAVLETPLAYMNSGARADGTIQGWEAIRSFFEASFAQPENGLGRWYRTGRHHASDRQVVWEYPRVTPQGDQVDLVEVMDIDDLGLIICHRVYWGWKGFQTLLTALDRKPQ